MPSLTFSITVHHGNSAFSWNTKAMSRGSGPRTARPATSTVPLLGVPSAPLNSTKAPALPTFTARAVPTPVPSPVMLPTAGVTVLSLAAVTSPFAFTVTTLAFVALPLYVTLPAHYAQQYGVPLALLGAVHQGGFMAMQTLWAGPWMVTVLGLTVAQTSQILFLFNFALMLSYLTLSWWAPRHISYGGNKGLPVLKVVAIGLAGSVLIQLLMLLLPFGWAWILWIAFAVVVTVTTLAQTHVSLSFPPKQVGRANSAFNLTLFIGAFSIQWGIGLVMDLFIAQGWSASASLRMACGAYLALQVAALLAFVVNRAQPDAVTAPATT